MTRPLIRCSLHLLLTTIKGRTQQVKWPIHSLVRKDLQPRAIQNNSSQPSGEKLHKTKGSPTKWVTRPLIRLKSNLKWLYVILLFTKLPRSYFRINKVLLPMLSTSWRPIHTAKSTEHCKDKGSIHTHKTCTVQNSLSKESLSIEENKKIVIITRPIWPKSNKEEKRQR